MPKYKVGVIFGSRSTEHEVSIVSAMQVIKFLSERHEVTPIYITKEGIWLTGPQLSDITTYKHFDQQHESELTRIVITPDTELQTVIHPQGGWLLKKPKKLELDVIFPVLHGAHGEDGTIQGLLELADIPYIGSRVHGSSAGIDKIIAKAILKESSLPVLDYLKFTRFEWEENPQAVSEETQKRLGFPIIVKPASLGSTIGIQAVNAPEDFNFAVDTAFNFDTKILVEPYITNRLEVNCAVLGNEKPIPSVCEQPVSNSELLSFEDKYMHGQGGRGMAGAKRIIPAPITDELSKRIQWMAVEAFRSLNCLGVARVDFLIDQDTNQVYVNEVNTMPGSISFYLWEKSGISSVELVDKLIDLAFQAHKEKHRTTFSLKTQLLYQADLLGLKK